MNSLQATTHAISNAGLARVAPSIFADQPDFEVSDRYAFVPTSEVVDELREAGWFPSFVAQSASKTSAGDLVAKHQVRFRQPGAGNIQHLNDSVFEICLTNSHDRSSGFQLDAGLFRKVCDNGLIVKDSNFGGVSIRHVSNAPELVAEAAENLTHEVPRLAELVDEWSTIQLDHKTQLLLANRGRELRWGQATPVTPGRLLNPHRYADNGSDLWSVFNRVQENLLKGGQRGRASTGRRMTTRGIGSIDVGRKLNQDLWAVASEIAAAA